MKAFLSNKWTKLGASVVSIVYLVIIIMLAVNTFLYQFVINRMVAFTTVYIILNLLFFCLLFFSKKEIITSIISMLLLPFVFAILIFNFGNWIIIIPPFVVAAIMFFACRAPETLKTIFGTIYLLLYILGVIAFFIFRLLMGGSNDSTVLNSQLSSDSILWEIYSYEKVLALSENNASQEGSYRFFIVDVNDGLKGRLEVYVEPNDMDKKYKYFDFRVKGYKQKIAVINSRGTTSLPQINWVSDSEIEYKFKGQKVKLNKINKIKKEYLDFLIS